MVQAATTRCDGSIRFRKTWKIGPFIFRRFTHGRGVNTGVNLKPRYSLVLLLLLLRVRAYIVNECRRAAGRRVFHD